MLSMRSAKRLNIFVPYCKLVKLLRRRTAAEPSERVQLLLLQDVVGLALPVSPTLLLLLPLLLVLRANARRKRLDGAGAGAGRSQMQRNF